MIALVRHADAGRRRREQDELRALNRVGLAQAAALVGLLDGMPFSQVLSSPYRRCRQTLEPLARARGLTVVDHELLGEGHGAADLIPLLVDLAPAGAALCSHGDVIGSVVARLVEEGLVSATQASFAKGSTWLLEVAGGSVVGARHLPPPTLLRAGSHPST